MPVNMDPSKKHRRTLQAAVPTASKASDTDQLGQRIFGEVTDQDREKDLAEAELKNLWDATEVIDMDKV